jgi:Cu(I)/Ag(I) efflux system membrane fusion protein
MDKYKVKEVFNHPYFRYGLILLAGLFLGWLLFSGGNRHSKRLRWKKHMIMELNQPSGPAPCTRR